jgi:predicted ATPase
MNEMTDSERIHRASEAKRMIENVAFVEAVSNLDKLYVQAWRNAQTVEAREDAHRYMMLLNQFSADIRSMIMDGAVTDKRIFELEGRKKGFWRV